MEETVVNKFYGMSTEFSCTTADLHLALYNSNLRGFVNKLWLKNLVKTFAVHNQLLFVGEVILDNSCPEEPPDFIFEDSDFCPNVADIKVQAKEFKIYLPYMY